MVSAHRLPLQPVFGVLLDKAMELCRAAFGMMMIAQGDQFPTVAAHGVPEAFRIS
jgi:hypothetical protein